MNDLAEIKRVSKSDLKVFLVQDHTSFSVLSVSCKHIESTDRISVTLSKNSAQSFYLDQAKKTKPKPIELPTIPKTKPDDCLQDAQNCTYFQFFNSKEKKLYIRFKDKVESNFEGTQGDQPVLFLTLTATFMRYAEDEGITSNFPEHWKNMTLNSDDIKHVNRFNKILFDKYFLGKDKDGNIDPGKSFWHKFIDHPDTKEQLSEIKETKFNETTNESEEIVKQKGIQIGEFFEFFWQKFDNKEIEEFSGKFEKPQKPKIEEIVEETVKLAANKMANDISKVIDIRLQELKTVTNETRSEIESGLETIATAISQGVEELTSLMAEARN